MNFLMRNLILQIMTLARSIGSEEGNKGFYWCALILTTFVLIGVL